MATEEERVFKIDVTCMLLLVLDWERFRLFCGLAYEGSLPGDGERLIGATWACTPGPCRSFIYKSYNLHNKTRT